MEKLFSAYPELSPLEADLNRALDILTATAKNDGLILCCGNGGSAADCEHIVGELMKGFLLKRPDPTLPEWASGLQKGIRAISLPSQSAVVSAFCNDVDAALVYAQLTRAYGRPGDALIGLSTSGNSKNVVNAWKIAKASGIAAIALVGETPCAADGLCDVVLHMPARETYRVQEYHLPVYHWLCASLEARLFGAAHDAC
ncbi:MAG: SIS domain-containing protein [Clostridiales bacterium]|jgi:D-sedoheptulose 7-phosphate isomerase|nr:SIS domain-containing protein [Clostridiales bacterium]